jgi:hypothetical protein
MGTPVTLCPAGRAAVCRIAAAIASGGMAHFSDGCGARRLSRASDIKPVARGVGSEDIVSSISALGKWGASEANALGGRR